MKKILCLMIAIVMCITGTCFSADAAIVDVLTFEDWDFYGRSYPELVYVSMDCDTASFYAEIETPDSPDTVEVLSCMLIGVTDTSFGYNFIFTADETVTTYLYGVPAGQYVIYFIGSSNIKKEYVVATFTKVD